MKREKKIRGEEEWKEGGVQMMLKGREAADEHSRGGGGKRAGTSREDDGKQREKGIMIEIENLRVVDGWRWRFR